MFLWHHALWLLLALPVLAGAYLLLLRRRHRHALRYASFALVREAMGRSTALRMHAAAMLLAAALIALILAIARPVVLTEAADEGVIVLLMDVSLSMAASDVKPTRLDAARVAVKGFIRAQPRDVKIGVVAFGGYTDVVQQPTFERHEVLAAIDKLELQRFTAIGTGLLGALLTILPTASVPSGYDIFGMGAPATPRGARKGAEPGSYTPAAIVLVSDGRSTMGVSAIEAAKLVAQYGIRVYTVGVGTLYGGGVVVEGWPTIHAEFEEQTLEAIAGITRGSYYLARDAEKLLMIYEGLGRRIVLAKSGEEISALFVAAAMMLSLAAAAVSLLRSGGTSIAR